jgi:peptide/nickel transport system substrate-binding protein
MDTNTKLQVGSLVMMGGVILASLMNTCAMDRLEQQVIATRKAVEGGTSAGTNSSSSAASAAVATDCAPLEPSGAKATGFGGASADITCVEGAAPGAPRTLADKPRPQGDVYTNRRTEPPGTLNFYTTNQGDTSTITKYILDRLIEVDPDSPPNVVPSLATSWEISDDRLTYTYKLRKGVQFADGRPFTSADVKFSFDVMRDPKVEADSLRGDFEDVESVTTPDSYTVVVKYKKIYWKGVYVVGTTLRILNKGWIQEAIPRYAETLGEAKFNTEPGKPGFAEVFNKIRVPGPGTGPYYYAPEEYDPEKPIELVQNPFSWTTQVRPNHYNLGKQRWIFISDESAAFEEFRKQKFDVTVVDFNSWDDEYSKDKTITDIANYFEYDHMGLAYSTLVWNARKEPFNDARVRKAMTHLTNRDWIDKEIERDRATVANCPSKPTYPNYLNVPPIAYDLAEAKRLLTEAGWKDTDGDGILDKNGKRFEFEIKVGSQRRFYDQVSAQVIDAAKQVGIRASVRKLEWATFVKDLEERNFDSLIVYESFRDPWIDNYSDFHSSQDVPRGGNVAGWRNKEVDALLEGMRTEFSDDKRNEMYQQFCKIFMDEQPMTLLVHGKVGIIQNKRFEDIKVRPTGMQNFDVWVKPENRLVK